MKIYHTHAIDPVKIADPSHKHWTYCGLDCCVTEEVRGNLVPRLNENQWRIYHFEKACEGPALTMQLRGFRIDKIARDNNSKLIEKEAREMMEEVKEEVAPFVFKWGKSFPPPSGQVGKYLFDVLKIPASYTRKGNYQCDKHVLERLRKSKPKAKKLCNLVLKLRDWEKQHEVLTKELSPDGRFRFTMAVGQTQTGRASSYKDLYSSGDYIHNKVHRLRDMFIPDPDMVFVEGDLEQAESRTIAYVAGDENYIRAHEEGNVHVSTASIFWPEFGWSKDAKENKERLKNTYVPWLPGDHFSYYDMCKRGQHGLNYGLTYRGLANWIGVKQDEAKVLWGRYFEAYPRIGEYPGWVKDKLSRDRTLVTPLGMERQFFSRYWENSTIREAIAYVPQSTVAQICWLGIWRVWKDHDPSRILVMQNGHDSGLYQVKVDDVEALSIIKKAMTVEVPVEDVYGVTRDMVIPVELGTGKNWRECK